MARLFIPGPTDVAPEVLAAQNKPMIGHRSQAFYALFTGLQPRLRELFRTEARVFITASSGTGLQEAAARNCVRQRLLLLSCGAFGDRWHQVAISNGVPVDRISSEWGQPNTPDQLEDALRSGRYDSLAVVHNETSTGVENPVAEIAARARELVPDILIFVAAVSSAGGAEIRVDDWGLDVLLTSSQKCLAVPPGLGLAAVSDRALARARSKKERGWYFDFVQLEKYLVDRQSTPATPAVSLIYALDVQLDRIMAEGIEARFARHRRLADQVRTWAANRFSLYAAEGYRSQTVTTIRKSRPIDIPALNAALRQHDMVIANGYGPIREETFRIGHMGEMQSSDLDVLLPEIDRFLDE